VTSLFEEKLVAELKVLNAQQTVTRLAGELDVHNRVINTRQSKRTESEAVIAQAKARFYRRAREEAALNQAEIAGVEERLKLASDQARRATIRSPIDGEVKNLRYHTVGGVVTPGDPILQIVPVSGQLVIDAELAPADRGLVASGLAANVKITAYDFIRYGGLQGTVTHLAPDTSTTDSGDSFYRLVVTTEQAYLGNDPNQNQITPGMDAIVEIKVGSQSVLDFLLRPVLKTRDEAFREP
jgi:adhesin transport system membrane fusion protein